MYAGLDQLWFCLKYTYFV
uniref:Uncharacterized protein n=1 Tax=Anguilla anguilla TaxID=7936 RepID=A0A0E9TVS4_ANGAN